MWFFYNSARSSGNAKIIYIYFPVVQADVLVLLVVSYGM